MGFFKEARVQEWYEANGYFKKEGACTPLVEDAQEMDTQWVYIALWRSLRPHLQNEIATEELQQVDRVVGRFDTAFRAGKHAPATGCD